MKRLLVLLALSACQGNHGAAVESSYAVADYAREGVPSVDHAWTTAEHTKAAETIARIVDGHRDRLPRMAGGSKPVFARMIEIVPADDTAAVDVRLADHAERFQAAGALSKLYNKDGMELPSTEWVELMAVELHEAGLISRLVDPYFKSLAPDDPSREARLAGLQKMRAGWNGMLQGGLLVAANNLVSKRNRLRMLQAIETEMPALYPLLTDEDRAGLRDLAAKLAAGTEGELHDAASRIVKVATPPE